MSLRWKIVISIFAQLFASRLIQGFLLTMVFGGYAIITHHVIALFVPTFFLAYYIRTIIFDFLVTVHEIQEGLRTFAWYSYVDINVFLGAIPIHSKHYAVMTKGLKIGAVLSINEQYELYASTVVGSVITPEEWRTAGISQLILPSRDFLPPSFEVLDKGADYINRQVSEGKKVYCHCKSGMGRSASVVIAYLMKYRQMDVHTAYATVKMYRSTIFSEKSPQLKNLLQYAETLRK